MTIEAWTPDTQDSSDYQISPQLLQRFIDIAKAEQWQQLDELLSAEEIQNNSVIMQQSKDSWFAAGKDLNDADLIELVRFFTKAEMLLSGWQAAEKSPVIWLVKILRRRACPPSKELLLWIKANSDNRFIPNGAL